MSRRRYTDEEKREALAKFTRHGGSAAAFCREQDLPYPTFLSWRRGQAGELDPLVLKSAQPPNFVEVELPRCDAPVREGATDPAVELVLGGGAVLRIYPTQSQRP